MIRFLIRRLLRGLVVLWLVTVVAFGLFFINPAGPDSVARRLGGKNATQATIDLIKQRLGLNQPITSQYWYFLVGHNGQKGLVEGGLGYDYYNGVAVTHELAQAIPITLSLAIGAAILWLSMGVFSGVISAIRPRTIMDRTLTGIALFFYSMPTFVLGLLLILVFYYDLTKHFGITIFPAGGYVPLTQDPVQWARYLLLPWITLAVVSAAAYTRLSRSSMLDVLGEDYIRTARAKGLRERRVVLRHGLRAALTPIVTQFGIDLGVLIGGAVVTENVFGLSGLGRLAVTSITQNDLPTILGIVIVASTAVVVANILVDIAYALLDPRVRLT
jgi:peptide/nickel transport system permease protein